MNSVRDILKLFLIWRLLIFIPVFFGAIFLNYGTSYPFFEITHYQKLPELLNIPLFKVWSNFDGVHYINVATNGYMQQARFFPLLPILIYILSIGNLYFPVTFLTAIFLPNIIFAGALIILYKLLVLDFSKKRSIDTLVHLLIFPTSFFFACVYTESVFLLILVSCFYLARKSNWLGALILGILLCTTRFVGIAILPALIYEYISQQKKLTLKNYLVIFLSTLIIPSGLIAYSYFNLKTWGNAFYFLTSHTELGNSREAAGLVIPFQTIFRYFKILTSLPVTYFEWWIALLEILSFFFGAILLYIAWKKKVRISYLIFSITAFLLPVLSGTFSGLPRYIVILFPIFLGISLIDSKRFRRIYIGVSGVFLFILMMFFSRGYFIA